MASNGTEFLHENADKLEKYDSEMSKSGQATDCPPPYAPAGPQVVVAQPQYSQQVVMAQREELPSNSNMVCFSVFVLLCCSLPLGIVALVFAVMASSAYTRDEAERKLRTAQRCNIAGVILGLILTPILIWVNYERIKGQQEQSTY